MTFIWPVMFLLFLILPLLVVLYLRFQRRRSKLVASYGSLGTAQGPKQKGPGVRRHVAPAFFLASLALLVVAMARPQTVVSVPKIEGTVILAFDVSGSMAATDIEPSRLDAAKAAAEAFVQQQPPGVQIGVVAFSDNGFSIQAPTNDQGTVLSALDRLTPQHGTSLANGINAALNAIAAGTSNQGPLLYSNRTPAPTPPPTPVPQGKYSSAVIVLLTDGENNENPDPMSAAQDAANRGVHIYTVGVGSPQGTNLHINGFTVFTQLDEVTLRQISQSTGATYYNAQSVQDLQNIYHNLTPQLIVKSDKIEITSLMAGASLLVLLIGGVFSYLWFNRLP